MSLLGERNHSRIRPTKHAARRRRPHSVATTAARFLLWIAYRSVAWIPTLVIPNAVAILVGVPAIIVALRLCRLEYRVSAFPELTLLPLVGRVTGRLDRACRIFPLARS